MLEINRRYAEHKTKVVHVGGDDDCDWIVQSVARRFGLKPHIARLVVSHAGLGGDGDRRATSGGRT